MAFIKANLERPISVPQLAMNVGFSKRHVYNAFREIFNQSIAESILSARMDKARNLLLKTQLNITQIAFESGFENYSHFSKAFHRKFGMPPSAYREQVMRLEEAPALGHDAALSEKRQEWFRDSFQEADLALHWKPVSGEWSQHKGNLIGSGEDNHIVFLRPLPENCRISLQAFAEPNPAGFQAGLKFHFTGEEWNVSYCDFTVALAGKACGIMTHFRTGSQLNEKACIQQNEWQDIEIVIHDNLLQLSVNDVPVFSFRDPFPPAYSRRCHLGLSSWHCGARFRRLLIHNLGFLPVIPFIRQGDILYNSGMAESAMDFYLRYLQAGPATDNETMELRYKIGMCCIGSGAFSQAKSWMDKVVALRDDPFWSEQARLALLEICWRSTDLQGITEQLTICLGDEKTCGTARTIAHFCVRDFDLRGLFDEAIHVLEAWLRLEQKTDYAYPTAKSLLSEDLLRMRRFGEAEESLKEIAGSTTSAEMILNSRINVMQLHHEQGDISASESLRRRIEESTKDPHQLVRCAIQEALNLRSQEQFEQALEVLKSVATSHPTMDTGFHIHTSIHIAFILCCLGRLEEGRRSLADARTAHPDFHPNSQHYLPFLLAEGNYTEAAESVLKDYRNSKELVSASAELGVKAGILHELAGLHEGAKAVFKEVSQRFPNELVRFFGQLAHALFSEKDVAGAHLKVNTEGQRASENGLGEARDAVVSNEDTPKQRNEAQGVCSRSTPGGVLEMCSKMPYEHFRRSEMFYLVGLLKEKRGDKAAARALFEASVKDDPALRWPAYFARRKINPKA